ncbi:MAG: TIGR03618 family F420-dependent PPOX class oxidoreductase [Dehalococcoidia bacterium]
MPVRLPRAQRERFLDGRHVAVLVTLAEDGTPVPTPIWYRYRDGLLYFRTATDAVKAENVRRDPRVSVCIQEERPPYKAVIVYGKAELREGDERLAAEIPRHYLGFFGAIGYQQTARTAIEAGAGEIVLVVTPERYASFDFGPETPWYGKLWLMMRRVLPPWL